MGESNQTRPVKYYFWTADTHPARWYASNVPPRRRVFFDIFDLTTCRWKKYKEFLYKNLCSTYDAFYKDHREIPEDEALKCIIGGPEYCHEFQKKVIKRARK